jgi:moderate conductance mechanosensitive channel
MENLSQFIFTGLVGSSLRIIVILALAYLSFRLLQTGSRYGIRRLQMLDGEDGSDFDKRIETVTVVVKRAIYVLIVLMAALMILDEVGADIRPLLTSLGIVGLAIGLAAQTLFKDIIGGIFILTENHFKVGDVIEMGKHIGTVEGMSLRVTRIRDLQGVVHIIPNSEIRIVLNRTRDWSRAIIDLGITYEDDVAHAMNVLTEIGEQMAEDPTVGPLLLESPVVLGIEALDDWQVRLRIMVKTLPNQQWTVQRYLRRQIKQEFARLGINLATPRQEIVLLKSGEA